jgi:hypothetical protein
MAHELRIAKPAIGYDDQRGQRHTALAESRHASIQHNPHPVQFVAARCPRAYRVGTPDGKVHGHYEFALADDDHEKDPINPREHPVCQRLRVASLLLATERHSGISTSRPKRRRRWMAVVRQVVETVYDKLYHPFRLDRE